MLTRKLSTSKSATNHTQPVTYKAEQRNSNMNRMNKIILVFCQRFFANANRHICFFANPLKPTQKKQKSLLPNAFQIGSIILLMILTTSCGPQSKESYLKKYDKFIEEVGNEYKEYDTEDWEKSNEKFDKYSNEYYDKFKEDLTWKEQIIVAKHQVKYGYYSSSTQISDIIKELFDSEEINQLREQIKYYSENQMEDDLRFLVEQAEELGKEAEKTIKQIMDELEINIEELSNE